MIQIPGRRIATLLVLAGLGACGPGGDGAPAGGSEEEDLAAIRELHRRDQAASRAGDREALMELWSEDPVALPPAGPIRRGREEMEAAMRRQMAAADQWEVLEYEQEFGEIEVIGDWAWDWGTYRGRSRHRETGREVSSSGRLLRILKRSPDGSWKVHRSIWNVSPEEPGGGPP